jgi:hypothetical protein
MNTIKRWVENFRWFFNHPPTHITSILSEGACCSYCGKEKDLWWFSYDENKENHWGVCYACQKRALDLVLKDSATSNPQNS